MKLLLLQPGIPKQMVSLRLHGLKVSYHSKKHFHNNRHHSNELCLSLNVNTALSMVSENDAETAQVIHDLR